MKITLKNTSPRIVRILLFVLACGAGGLALGLLMGESSRRVGPLEMRLSLHYGSPGRTELVMNPFGRILAHTHTLPVALAASIESIDVDEVREIIDNNLDVAKIKRNLKNEGIRLIARFLLKLFVLSALGGALAAAIGRRLEWKVLLAGGVSGAAAMAVLLAALGLQFNPAAFNKMQYSGVLSDSLFVLPDIQKGFRAGMDFNNKLNMVVENLADAYFSVDKSQLGHSDHILVLHISDLHNNPIAAEMVCRINAELNPDVILNTGDITDLGLPLELKFLQALKCLDKPHVFVAGNHDLPSVAEELAHDFGVIVPHGQVIEAAGLRIIGYNSPPPFKGRSEISNGRIRPWANNIRKTLEALPSAPDIIMLHYPGTARSLAGRAPVILYGHTHEAGAESLQGSLLVNAGSAGATGIRSLLQTQDRPGYTVALITFKKSGQGRPKPLYADIINLDPNTGIASLVRTSAAVQNMPQSHSIESIWNTK